MDEREQAGFARLRVAVEEDAVLGAAEVGLVLLDRDGRVAQANGVFRRLAEALGSSLDGALRSAELHLTRVPWLAALAGHAASAEVELSRSGAPVVLYACAEPLRDAEGKVTGAVVTFHPVEARTHEDSFRDQYLALVSHDLRHPLNNIFLRAQMLQRGLRESGDEEWARFAADICANVTRMDGMIRELIDVYRAESGSLHLQLEAVDVVSLMQDCVRAYLPPEAEARTRVRGAGRIWARVDRRRIERVGANLLTNAAKYSGGLGAIDVVVGESSAGEVVITVTDRGAGIDADELPHLFEKFFRSRSAPTRAPGFGLGLYVSRLIVEAHGGRIWADCRRGETTFSFSLPAAVEHASVAVG